MMSLNNLQRQTDQQTLHTQHDGKIVNLPFVWQA